MPTHKSWFDDIFIGQIERLKPKSAIDVGVGHGDIAEMILKIVPDAELCGVEIFEGYITDKIEKNYVGIDICDVRDFRFFEVDLVVFGDVLKHMPKEDAFLVLDRALSVSKWVIVNTPYGFLDQGKVYGNEHERHVCGFYGKEFEDEYDVVDINVGVQDDIKLMNLLIKGAMSIR